MRRLARSPQNGSVTMATTASTTKTLKMRLARVLRLTVKAGRVRLTAGAARGVSCAMSVTRLRKQALGSQQQDQQKDDVTREDLRVGVELGTDRLRAAEDDAARQRAPQAAHDANDHRFEGKQQPDRAGGGIEGGADRQEHGGG